MTAEADEEERAWALRLARAFLAPPGASSVAGRQSSEEGGPPPLVVLAALVVPLPVPPEARGAQTVRRRGEDEQEQGEQDG